jgi:hypothetical protein
MKIKEAIDRADELSPNAFSQDLKRIWLSTLDHLIYEKIILTHEGHENVTFAEYGEDTDLFETDLLVPEPFTEIYVYWLKAKMDEANGEYTAYIDDRQQYNTLYSDFSAWYNRTHMPIQTAREVFF